MRVQYGHTYSPYWYKIIHIFRVRDHTYISLLVWSTPYTQFAGQRSKRTNSTLFPRWYRGSVVSVKALAVGTIPDAAINFAMPNGIAILDVAADSNVSLDSGTWEA